MHPNHWNSDAPAGAAFTARATVLAPVAVAATLVGVKAASVERSTAPATGEIAAALATDDKGIACGEVCSAETWWKGGCIY